MILVFFFSFFVSFSFFPLEELNEIELFLFLFFLNNFPTQKNYLLDFEERVPKMRKEKKRDRYLNGEYNENGDYSNAMLLVGGYGTNKTCSVYAIAEELGMQVLEINSSTRRTG